MNATQAGRLLTLAYFLKTEVPRNKFDMGQWGFVSEWDMIEDDVNTYLIRRPDDYCGTKACALGWATAIWPKRFQLEFDGCTQACVAMDGVGHDQVGVAAFFGISEYDYFDLFHGGGNTPKQKAREIEQLVRQHGYDYAEAV